MPQLGVANRAGDARQEPHCATATAPVPQLSPISQQPLSVELGQQLRLSEPSPGSSPAVAMQNTILSCLLTSSRATGREFYKLENQFGCKGVVILSGALSEENPAAMDEFPRLLDTHFRGIFQTSVAVPSKHFLRDVMESRNLFPAKLLSPVQACLSQTGFKSFPTFCRFSNSQIERFGRLWSGKIYALDCEMVHTRKRNTQLGSVCVFDQSRRSVYSTICKPDSDDVLVDCVTKYSGLTQPQIARATLTAREIGVSLFRLFLERSVGGQGQRNAHASQALQSSDVEQVYSVISEDYSESFPPKLGFSWETPGDTGAKSSESSESSSSSISNARSFGACVDALLDAFERGGVRLPIIVGHAITNDLTALRFGWPLIIDTLDIYSPLRGRMSLSLKSLADSLLGRKIQAGKRGHNAGEDALATLDVCTMYLRMYGLEINSYALRIPPILTNSPRQFCLAAEALRLAEDGRERVSVWHLRSTAQGAAGGVSLPSPPECSGPTGSAGVAQGFSDIESCTGQNPTSLSKRCEAVFTGSDVTWMDEDSIRRALAACLPEQGLYTRPLIVWSCGDIGRSGPALEGLSMAVRLVDEVLPLETVVLVFLQGERSCLVCSHVVGQKRL